MTAIGVKKKSLKKKQEELCAAPIIGEDEEVTGVIEEVSYGDTLQQLEEIESKNEVKNQIILVESIEMSKIYRRIQSGHAARKGGNGLHEIQDRGQKGEGSCRTAPSE
jgi:hypothetical protein